MDRLTLLVIATQQPNRAMVYRHEDGNEEVSIECAACSLAANDQVASLVNQREAFDWTYLAMAETSVVNCRHCNCVLEYE